MITNLFVPYEIALKLVGFDEPCFAYYRDGRICGVNKWDRKDWEFHIISLKEITNTTNEIVLAPTYQQVIDWLREKYKLHVYITYVCWPNLNEDAYTPHIARTKWKKTQNDAERWMWKNESTYEEAILVGIKEALKLIK